MKLTVYTAIIGNGLKLRDPSVKETGVRYVCFTDREDLDSKAWAIKRVRSEGDPRLQSRQIKSRPDILFPGADVTLWLDSKFQLRCEPIEVAEEWLATWDMVAFRHPDRDCIEDEAIAIAQFGMASREAMEEQIKAYQADGFPKQRAITSTGFCLRRNTPMVRHFGELWWDEIRTRCIRDQMSIDYCAWKVGLKIGYLAGHYRENKLAKWIGA